MCLDSDKSCINKTLLRCQHQLFGRFYISILLNLNNPMCPYCSWYELASQSFIVWPFTYFNGLMISQTSKKMWHLFTLKFVSWKLLPSDPQYFVCWHVNILVDIFQLDTYILSPDLDLNLMVVWLCKICDIFTHLWE